MFRRSFRRGLTLGLLGGALMTALRVVRARRQPTVAATPEWPPIPDATPVVVPESRPAGTEVRSGNDAVEHFADASRQTPRPLTDWEPTAPLPPAEETTALTPTAVSEKPASKTTTKKKKAAPRVKKTPWVEPVDGTCPTTHPVKGKLASAIFHLPGGLNYTRTRPDRCYVDAAAAEADGLRPAKR